MFYAGIFLAMKESSAYLCPALPDGALRENHGFLSNSSSVGFVPKWLAVRTTLDVVNPMRIGFHGEIEEYFFVCGHF